MIITLAVILVIAVVMTMTGRGGGNFYLVALVLLCGVPMNIAVGTSSAMVAVTALMGFIANSANGHFIAEQEMAKFYQHGHFLSIKTFI